MHQMHAGNGNNRRASVGACATHHLNHREYGVPSPWMLEQPLQIIASSQSAESAEIKSKAMACDTVYLFLQFHVWAMSMIELYRLSDEELRQRASDSRAKALQGDRLARGIAHQLETELRRRAGAPCPDYDTLDLRSLELRQPRLSWWQRWRARQRSRKWLAAQPVIDSSQRFYKADAELPRPRPETARPRRPNEDRQVE